MFFPIFLITLFFPFILTTPIKKSSCPPNAILSPVDNQTCFIYLSDSVTLDIAESHCNVAMNRHAASVSSVYENLFLQNYLKNVTSKNSDPVWLGATAYYKEHCNWSECDGKYIWIWNDNQPFGYENFDPSLNSTATQFYGVVLVPSTGLWHRARMDQQHATICRIANNDY